MVVNYTMARSADYAAKIFCCPSSTGRAKARGFVWAALCQESLGDFAGHAIPRNKSLLRAPPAGNLLSAIRATKAPSDEGAVAAGD